MDMAELESLKYPVGKYEPEEFSETVKVKWLADIKYLPGLLEQAVLNLDANQLDTPYREGGWTIQQVVHHVSDSHMNALVRIKWTLTEDNPLIKAYNEKAWAGTSEYKNLPINISLTMLHTIHAKMYDLFSNMKEEEWKRTYIHPEHQKQFTLWYLLGMYAWHGKHHVAHIVSLRERMNW
jgi:hypothetical protein